MDTSPARTEETQLRLPRHLKGLEAESIEIMREVVAESKKPVMLYSIGKDSRRFTLPNFPFHFCTSTPPGSFAR
jgi:3'-phosphoadenosine 5'-phosphosulfate sulfotransferase (PAPS reductase)/FAD synthetase